MSSRVRVLSVFGTRPEAIKIAPVLGELERRSDRFESLVCVTAQHRQMLDPLLALFGIHADADLDLMQPNQTLADLTARSLSRVAEIIDRFRPHVVLVQGDTTTAMASALAAFYHRVAVGHVEAGLRTGRRYSPFPEEMNRSVIGRIASLHFAPTVTARDALLREGLSRSDVFVTGNTVIDALLQTVARVSDADLPCPIDPNTRLILVTAHRRESFGQPLENICEALVDVANRFSDVQIVYPVHLNPNVQQVVHQRLSGVDRIQLLAPIDYAGMAAILQRAFLVLTDSGGLQEEAPALGKPVLVMRDDTERPEAVAAGTARLVGTQSAAIVAAVSELLCDPAAYAVMASAVSPYGDGHAAERIADILQDRLGGAVAASPN